MEENLDKYSVLKKYFGYTQFRTADDGLGGDIYSNTIHDNLFISKAASQLCTAFVSDKNNLSTIGTMSNNIYARPIDDNITFSTDQPSTGSVSRTLSQWQMGAGRQVQMD